MNRMLLSLDEYIQRMYEEVYSEFNRYCAALALGREATAGELFEHWDKHGGRKQFVQKFPW